MTQGLGFCEFCGAGRIMVAQARCIACGREISQPPELDRGRAPSGPAAATPHGADVPVPSAPEVPDASSFGVERPPAPPPWAQVPISAAQVPAARRGRLGAPVIIGIALVAVVAVAVGVYVAASPGAAPRPSPSAPGVAAGSSTAPATTSTSPTAASPTAASPTSAPTQSLAPTPAPDVTPQITTGSLTGTLLSDSDSAPVAGAGVILCLKSDSACTTDASLVATSDSAGAFEIDAIPAGIYVVLYSPDGAPGSAALGLTIDVGDQSASCLGQGFTGSMPESCAGSVPFADDGKLTLGGESQIGISATGMTITRGTIRSPKYGLSLNFEAGQPLSVTVTPGAASAVSITVR